MHATVTLYYKSPESDRTGETPGFRYSGQIEGRGWCEIFSLVGNYKLYESFTMACRQLPQNESFLVDLAVPKTAAAASPYVETLKL